MKGFLWLVAPLALLICGVGRATADFQFVGSLLKSNDSAGWGLFGPTLTSTTPGGGIFNYSYSTTSVPYTDAVVGALDNVLFIGVNDESNTGAFRTPEA
jgi:hypothetical protein